MFSLNIVINHTITMALPRNKKPRAAGKRSELPGFISISPSGFVANWKYYQKRFIKKMDGPLGCGVAVIVVALIRFLGFIYST